MNDHIRFDMCVNDEYGHGVHTGKLRAAQFSDRDGNELSLECVDREMVCRKLDDRHIRVGRRTFPILSYGCYVGNMVWDSAVVTVETASAIADVLRASGKYAPIYGSTEWWDRWEAGESLFAAVQEGVSA
jgi:hypothetical protein